MATENLVTGKFYRILKDKTTDLWDRISFWTHSDDVQTAGGISLTSDLTTKDQKISSAQTDFAQIETSSVSTHAYVKGNCLMLNGQLYRVTSAIAVGGNIVEGTNVEAISVGTLSNMLSSSDGKGFYFDVKDGTYGFYPTALKQAEEFVPFGGTVPNIEINSSSASASYAYWRVYGVRSWYDAGYRYIKGSGPAIYFSDGSSAGLTSSYYDLDSKFKNTSLTAYLEASGVGTGAVQTATLSQNGT